MVGFARPALPTPCFLAAGVLLLFWDDSGTEQAGKFTVERAGTSVPAPVLRLSAPLESGGSRLFLAFASPADAAGPVTVRDQAGASFSLEVPEAEAGPDQGAVLDAAATLSGLADAGRIRLFRFLLHTCRTALGIGDDARFAANMRRLVDEVSLRPDWIEPRALLSRHHVLATGRLPATLGDNVVALTIGSDTVQESFLPPSVVPTDVAGRTRYFLHLAISRTALARDVRVVVLGAAGVAMRRLAAPAAALEPAVSWLAAESGAPRALRDYALECLTALGPADEAAGHAARELIVLASPDGIAIEPDCAIAAGERLFFGGRLFDPRNLVVGIEFRVGRWSSRVDRDALAIFPHPGRDASGADTRPCRGVAALASGSGRVPASGMARVALQLRSGALIESGAVPLLADPDRASTTVLHAVPAAAVSDGILRDVLVPALDALADEAARVSQSEPEIIEIGPQPDGAQTSVILPFGTDRGVFATWAAALGGGAWDAAATELLFVQPSTAPLADTERALAALHRRFGVPSRLVRLSTAGTSASLNPAVQAARCDRLLFLGGACLPRERNALSALLATLADRSSCGVVGGAVLDPSGAICHAGFAPPRQETLISRHAGFPAPVLYRDTLRPVFACSSAFLGVRRAVFEAAGGFSRAYRTRDWADADFSLRVRAQGQTVLFVPQARVVSYGNDRGPRKDETAVARRVDARRFAREQETEIAEWRDGVPAAAGPEAEQRPAVPSSVAAVDPRWAA